MLALMDKNTIRIDYVDNPALRELFSTKEPGDTMSLEMEITVSEVNTDYAMARLDEISAETEGPEEQEPVTPDESEPVAIVVMKRRAGMKPTGMSGMKPEMMGA